MKRDVLKAADDYQKMVGKLPNNQGAFFAGDVQQIVENCRDPWSIAMTALEAGFMTGYRFAMKQAEKKKSELIESGVKIGYRLAMRELGVEIRDE